MTDAVEMLNPTALAYIGYYHHIFPTRTYIATGLFQLMGGGGRVVTAVILAIITDVSSPDSRTQYFWYLEVADFATQQLHMADAAQQLQVVRVSARSDGLAVIRLCSPAVERTLRTAKAKLPLGCLATTWVCPSFAVCCRSSVVPLLSCGGRSGSSRCCHRRRWQQHTTQRGRR